MRLKTFTAPTTAEAMELVHRELGEAAIVVASQKGVGDSGVRITAALEAPDYESDLAFAPEAEAVDIPETLRQILIRHGLPVPLTEQVLRDLQAGHHDEPVGALAAALDASFVFDPLPDPADRPPPHTLMLVGPPGAGKTLATAKLATRASMNQMPLRVITTDTKRAGGIEQLEAFTRILGLPLAIADSPEALGEVLASEIDLTTIIDTPGCNPYGDSDMERLSGLVQAAHCHPVLVLAGGGDALEAADMAAAYAPLECDRLLVTRLDMTRRLGSLISAAQGGRLKFSNVSTTPQVADGLSALNPMALARLIVPPFHATQDSGPMIASAS
ncbi:hypothetical protein [Magnetospira sp. QH-2]|uniref:flagellar biosynthesis protein FlhF n=1 Tax=Magnetospira sp. (strain QH-2) TaxID=1288970 RepID=UPI0003E8170A|nr:hypothetical protein [Magnetospira sp. QH-2]CCQ73044.1 putative Flagellar GTP-binding protein FlhF [Magnetospira sp. QH-2]